MLPSGFSYLTDLSPDIVQDLRYFGNNNFLGRPVRGYKNNQAILTIPAAQALATVQSELISLGLYLYVFDAYRPQQAVEHFLEWEFEEECQQTRQRFHPNLSKVELFEKGYLSPQSSHTRGSTVDLSIAYKNRDGAFKELDMGTEFDYFGKQSWPSCTTVTPQQRANRTLLQALMTQHGFLPFQLEWWHFTLQDEPFPDTSFNFPVE